MPAWIVVCVFLSGGLGAVVRFVLNTSIQRWWNRIFPLSTFLINCIAAFFAGIAAAAYFYETVSYSTYLLFVTGFCGGFSTFSTAINEMVGLLRGRHVLAAVAYFLVTMFIPILCVMLGWVVGSLNR
ncbi:CrcB family protein [Bifidobacterium sp. BRDM6]|uniref:Fluoride-specific ion channel FluC n=1 Tax=Bifidobacterium choloepi TaxID=2614131 RepID=A0A6I5N7T2_9BIFI|nr:CrcB family protein [Bifidobacterium choloepi]